MARKIREKNAADSFRSSIAGRKLNFGLKSARESLEKGVARTKSIVQKKGISKRAKSIAHRMVSARKAGAKRVVKVVVSGKELARKIWNDPLMKEFAEKQAKLIKETLDKAERKFKKRVNW